MASSSWVASLNNEVPNNTMELGLVVVVLQAQLDKVPASLRTLPREELDLDVADARLQTNFAGGRRLVDVDLAHFHTTWSRKSVTWGLNI